MPVSAACRRAPHRQQPRRREKWSGAPRCGERPRFVTAVSRILSSRSACADGLNGHLSCPLFAERTALAGCDQYPEGSVAFARDRAGDPCLPVLSCTTWGFSCPRACARGGGLLPRLFTLAAGLRRVGGMFSVTLSVEAGFRRLLPRVLRGMLPFGVRTFLSPVPFSTGERPFAIRREFIRRQDLRKQGNLEAFFYNRASSLERIESRSLGDGASRRLVRSSGLPQRRAMVPTTRR